MNNICTTIEQSKKLVELGIDVNTADMCYRIVAYNPNDTHVYQPYCFVGTLESDIPAWSLSALLELFDDKAGIAKEYGTWFAYDNGKSHCSKHCDNPLDAAFKMVCWLKENGKI